MTLIEAQRSVKKWKRWAATVRGRWLPDSPMVELADRMVQVAERRLMECQEQTEQG